MIDSNPAEGFITAADGLKLFVRRWEVPNPRALCFIAHGLGEHSGRYGELAGTLNKRLCAVWALDHRGHGRSQGHRGDCASFENFVEDLHRLVLEAQGKNPALPCILIGHSLGGLIALAYACEHPEGIRAVAVSSPALKLAHPLPGIKVALVHLLNRCAPMTPVPNGVNPNNVSRDPQVVAAYKSDPLIGRIVSARCGVALEQALKDAPRLAHQLKVPCLSLQAGADRICDAQASEEFAKTAKKAPIRFRRYEGFYHELFNEPERKRVMEDLCQWLEEVLR